jgi:hypothetical protein
VRVIGCGMWDLVWCGVVRVDGVVRVGGTGRASHGGGIMSASIYIYTHTYIYIQIYIYMRDRSGAPSVPTPRTAIA